MNKQPTYKFTSRKNNELTLSNRWDRDTRSVYEDRDPTELRQGDKIQGRGQILDFFEVSDACACCAHLTPSPMQPHRLTPARSQRSTEKA